MQSLHLRHLFALCIIALSIFWLSNTFFGGYLGNAKQMGLELWASPENLEEWQISHTAPYKYRLLFPLLVNGLYTAFKAIHMPMSFHWVYVWVSFATLVFALCSFYYLALFVRGSAIFGFISVLAFLLSPAIVFSHSVPVHTREDFLAYGILCLGLYMLLRKKYLLFWLLTILGVLCRETLMILPFVFFFFQSKDLEIWKKYFITTSPILIYMVIRWLLWEENVYDIWLGVKWNLENPMQAIFFVFLSFHSFWILYLYRVMHPYPLAQDDKLSLFHQSSNWVLLLIMASSFVFGILNEIRLVFLFFPWMILLGLDLVFQSWNVLRYALKNMLFKRLMWFSVALASGIIFLILYFQEPIKEDRYHNDSIIPIMIGATIYLIINVLVLYILHITDKLGVIDNE
jgi:hypothetical protein